jgi:ABC-type lipoprotein release transport system permease subunit
VFIIKLAFRNLLGAGLRTWLNVIVLSFAFFAIITIQGLLKGMNRQTAQAMLDSYYGGGQYWSEKYDPFDPLTLEEAHQLITEPLLELVESEAATPFLIIPGTIYPAGRLKPVIINGIDPGQKLLSIPSQFLSENQDAIPALIGERMAESTGLRQGDYVTLQWRDVNGSYDAREIKIVQLMKTSVQTIDVGQLWIPLVSLQEMAGTPGEATVIIVRPGQMNYPPSEGWYFKDLDFLLKDINDLIQSKTVGSAIIYLLLLFLAMLAVFDTQVLSIFRRRKEMGTLMALGMHRGEVIKLFTLEGGLHGFLAALLAAIYGIPLLSYFAKTGWKLPTQADAYGFAIGEKLYPAFSAALVIGTTLLVLLVTTVVSFLPTRKISHLKPTDALRGRMA